MYKTFRNALDGGGVSVNIPTTPTWHAFDAWLNRNPSRRPEQITEDSGICDQCDALVDRMAQADPVTRTMPWNQNPCPECWAHRRPKGRRRAW